MSEGHSLTALLIAKWIIRFVQVTIMGFAVLTEWYLLFDMIESDLHLFGMILFNVSTIFTLWLLMYAIHLVFGPRCNNCNGHGIVKTKKKHLLMYDVPCAICGGKGRPTIKW